MRKIDMGYHEARNANAGKLAEKLLHDPDFDVGEVLKFMTSRYIIENWTILRESALIKKYALTEFDPRDNSDVEDAELRKLLDEVAQGM